ncbi:tetratricopeptide repeat protein [bacterium]|nr:tetratricopeptide repeat protein [bacterium]
MGVDLREKVKKYIKANYGKFSVLDVSEKFGVSPKDVEEYIIDDLPKEMEEEQGKGMPASGPLQSTIPGWINKTLIALVLLAIATLIIALTISQLSNNDLWQHLKNGQMILQTKRFQYADPYSCNAAGTPWINEAWFSGVIFYIIYLIVGVNGIIYLKTLCILMMTGLVLLACHKLKTEFILFVPLTVFMIFNVGVRFLARTEMFSYCFISAYLLIIMLYKYRRSSKNILYLLPILQIFWSNMHGSFIVGLIILAVFTGCETIRLLVNRYITFWQKDLMTWRRLKPLYIIFLLTLLACLINPYGARLLLQPFHITMRNKEYIKTIYEWQSPFESPTFRGSYAFKYYVIWMFLLGAAFIANLKRTDLSNLILSAIFFIMAAKMHRNITIFTIATCPVIALNFQQAGSDFLHFEDRKLKDILKSFGMIIIIGIMIPLIMISFKHGYIYRKNSSKPFGLGVASNMPIMATEYIKANHIKGCCFNSYTYGTYLIFHCFPDVRVTMDSRAEHVYGEEFYRRHQRALYDVNVFEQIMDEFGIEFILLKYQDGDLARHCEYLNRTGDWALVYFDDSCFLYIRRLDEYKELIARDELKYIHPLLTMEQSKIRMDDLDDYIREGERILGITPKYPFPHMILLNLYGAKGDWPKVVEHGEFLISNRYGNYSTFMLMGSAYIYLNKPERAKDMYQKALEKQPGSKEALRALEILRMPSNT